MRALCARTASLNTMHEIMCVAFMIYHFFSKSKNTFNK